MSEWTRREWLHLTGGALGAAVWQVPRAPFNVKVSERSLLAIGDLSFEGQVGHPSGAYANMALGYRYVPDSIHGTQWVNGVLCERRFITYLFNGGAPEHVGDLVEYAVRAPLTNGNQHWTLAEVPSWTETRRWKNWIAYDRYGTSSEVIPGWKILARNGGNGIYPAGFYWDERSDAYAPGLLWFTLQPQYSTTPTVDALVWAVRLVDAESGGSVSDSNVFGPYYFRSASITNDFKDGTCGFIPIPANRQAAMGGKILGVGHHCAGISASGPRGVGMWLLSGFPAALPVRGSVLWPNALHIYDTSTNSGLDKPNMKKPNVSYQGCWHASQGIKFWASDGGVATAIGAGGPVGLSVGDCLYQQDEGPWSDTITLRMSTPARGGAWVPEVYVDGQWIQPAGWAMASGAADLSQTENAFYWPQCRFSSSNPEGLSTGYWVRLRRVAAGLSGGAIETFIITSAVSDANPYRDRPLGQGGTQHLGSEQYDATHYAYCYEEYLWGGAWVQTANVEGLAYFGPLKTERVWYGGCPAWMQPYGGGVPVLVEMGARATDQYGNGGRVEGQEYPFFFPFDHRQIMECAAGTRPRNNSGLNPAYYAEMFAAFPGLIAAATCPNANSPFFGLPTFDVYGWGHCVLFDALTSEVIVMLSNGATGIKNTIVGFWKAR